ncbi:MAG: S41 family peptidase [Candidatus Omnitrophota bacterium]
MLQRFGTMGIWLAVSIFVGIGDLEAEIQPHAGMLRYPDVSASHIVFVYANDLWLVSREGGTASPLASPPGPELFPRFSPDGQSVAFIGNYDGDRDVYVMPTAGGSPFRVTYHPANEMLCDWTAGNQILFFSNALAGQIRQDQLFAVSPSGGLPKKLPLPYGTNGAIDSSGEWLAYTPISRDFRTWKRYRGGWASDIWLFHLKNYSSKKITSWEGTDTFPMWHGKMLYYLSDEGSNHRLNIWSYNTANEERRQITNFKDFDVKFPAIGPGPNGEGEIVLQNGAALVLLNLGSGETKNISVTIPGDRPKIREQRIDLKDRIAGWDISPTGKRIVMEARGEIWTLPAKEGSDRNLTRTSGFAERDPSWSPDGQWIAYFSDESGEYELYIMQSDGKEKPRQLTSGGKAWRFNPVWSPDSKHIAFTDKTGSLFLLTVKSQETQFIDKDPWADRPTISWSHDSGWIAYTKNGDNRRSSIWLYNLETQKTHPATSGLFGDTWPAFDRKGDFLFFASNRNFSSPIYDDVGTSFVYADTDVLITVPLRKDVENPYIYKSDEESWKKDEKESKDKDEKKDEAEKVEKKEEKKESSEADKKDSEEKENKEGEKKEEAKSDKEAAKPLVIDLDGFEQRAFQLPIPKGGFRGLAVNHEGKLIYVREAPRGSGGKTEIKIFDLKDEKKEEKTVLSDAGRFAMSADGKKLLVDKGGFYVIDAAADQKLENAISTSNLFAMINPREEWKQMFNDGWRVMRDYFYDPNMHGVDWKGMRDHYSQMLPDCNSREDLNYVIDEMISELNVGHAYNRGNPDMEDEPSVNVGLLGVDFELANGAYRIAQIYEGAAWDVDARNPLSCLKEGEVKVGDYLLAVNRVPIDASKDPWAAFVGLANQTVTLAVSDKPILDATARDAAVKLLDGDHDLRYRAWIEKNRAYVDKKTDGKVGYIFVPNTGVDGQSDLVRQFYGQIDKQALIIDERWNGGGQIPTRFIELLNRPIVNYWARRDGKDWPWPPDSHQGPKCMLINGMSASGGDAFPAYFRQAGLGKLIGMRTWGGLVGLSGNPSLIDGGSVVVPTFAFYEKNGTWGIEGHGVDPDIEVVDDPSLMVNGGDPQLDAAIELMIQEIKTHPYTPPARPAYPNRSGMGIREEDK